MLTRHRYAPPHRIRILSMLLVRICMLLLSSFVFCSVFFYKYKDFFQIHKSIYYFFYLSFPFYRIFLEKLWKIGLFLFLRKTESTIPIPLPVPDAFQAWLAPCQFIFQLRRAEYSKPIPFSTTRLAGGDEDPLILLSICCGRSRCRSQYPGVRAAFEAGLQAAAVHLPCFAEKLGLEPRHLEGLRISSAPSLVQLLLFLRMSCTR